MAMEGSKRLRPTPEATRARPGSWRNWASRARAASTRATRDRGCWPWRSRESSGAEPLAPHEPVGDADDRVRADDFVAGALVEAHVLRLVGFEVADLVRLVEAAAVLLHDQRPDPSAL